jgi:polyisoprenoid-binding protein YceI
MHRSLILFVIVIASSTAPATADMIQVELVPEETSIEFTLKATLHTVHGTAALESATFVFDTETGAASGEAVVAAASANTGNDKRDRKMHGKVLLSSMHPRIAIRAERFEGDLDLAGTSAVTLVGEMALLGATHPIRVPMTVAITDDTATVEATFSVPYVEWGLKDPSTFVLRVAKEVPVTVRVEEARLAHLVSQPSQTNP